MNTRNRISFILIVTILFCLTTILGFSEDKSEAIKKVGIIKGWIIDEEVKSPIPDVKVTVLGSLFATYSDVDGAFTIADVPVGSYILELSCRFYRKRLIPDVIVKSQRISHIQAELQLENSLHEHEEVTVTAGYFSGTELQTTSVANFSYEEIRRAAGSAGDVSRIISGLPSIARVNDLWNNLVVRGGSPAENAFYIDNIEIPNINHYPSLGSTAGAIGLLNVDFIRDVHFYSGGFSPIYGGCLSSVMEIDFREGNRDEHDYQFDLSMMGIGIAAEGPLSKNKGAWMFSARRSYIDLLIELMGSGVPVTWSDFQGKLDFNLSPAHKLTFLGLLGVDESGTDKDDALKDRESTYGSLDTTEYTTGLNWSSMWGSKGYSETSLSLSNTRYKDISYETVTEDLAREGQNTEKAITLRNVNTFRFNETNTVCFGVEVKHLVTDYAYVLAEYTDVLGNAVPEISRDTRISSNKYAAFADHTWSFFPRLTLSLGIRADHFSYNRHTHLSPRFSISFKVTNRTSIDAAAGVFYQHLPLILLLQSENHRELKDPVAYHLVLGWRHLLTDNTRLTIEAYDKEYDHLPLDPIQPSLFIFDELIYGGFFTNHETLTDKGKARSYGVEIMIQKKLTDKVYGVLSASYFRTRYQDLQGVWRNRVYDNRYIFAVEGGYKPSNSLEFGVKWNYAGGAPFTPFDIEASRAANSGIFDWTQINRYRLPSYHSLNIRFDKRFYFGSSNLTIYLSLWNVFNRKNIISYYWNTIEKKPDKFCGWGLLPALGIEFEF